MPPPTEVRGPGEGTSPRYVFLGTPAFSASLLERLLISGVGTCTGVFTMPDKPKGRGQEMAPSPVAAQALKSGLPCFKPPKVSSDEGIAQLESCRADVALIVAYGQIIKPPFFTKPRFGTYNLHFSLLPRWRGASPVPAAILAGDPVSGVTLQRINEGLDTGDIAAQASFPIQGKSAPQVFEQSLEVSYPLLTHFLQNLPDLRLVPQDHPAATHCGKMHKDSGRILPSSTCEDVRLRSLAFEPWPGIFAIAGGRRYKMTGLGQAVPGSFATPGLYRRDRKSLDLALADGHFPVTRLQKEGGKEMDVASFLNACPPDFSAPLDPA